MSLEFDDENESVNDVVDEMSLKWAKFLNPEVRKEIIKYVIDNADMRKSELAEILEVSLTALQKFERGIISPSDATIINALKALKPYQIRELLINIVIPELKEAYESAVKDLDVVDKYLKNK